MIASQAVITGAYWVASQAAQLGYLPRVRVVHTSESTMGQIYVPWINGLLLVAVLILVFAFRSSAALAFGFGMAVTGTITISTLLFFYIARIRWGTPLWLIVLGAGTLLSVDLLFLAANMTKLVHGAWLPLLIAAAAFTVMTTWQRGSDLVTKARAQAEGPLREFIDHLAGHRPPLVRIAGTAVFLNRGKETAPLAMRAKVEHNRVPPSRPGPNRRPDCHRRRLLLPLEAGAEGRLRADDGSMAKAPFHSHLLHRSRCRRVFWIAQGPDVDHGRADSGVGVFLGWQCG